MVAKDRSKSATGRRGLSCGVLLSLAGDDVPVGVSRVKHSLCFGVCVFPMYRACPARCGLCRFCFVLPRLATLHRKRKGGLWATERRSRATPFLCRFLPHDHPSFVNRTPISTYKWKPCAHRVVVFNSLCLLLCLNYSSSSPSNHENKHGQYAPCGDTGHARDCPCTTMSISRVNDRLIGSRCGRRYPRNHQRLTHRPTPAGVRVARLYAAGTERHGRVEGVPPTHQREKHGHTE